MLEIGNTIVSFEVFEHLFCCNLDICKGQCCVEGDAGAPLTNEEVEKINKILPKLYPLLSEKALETIDKHGISYIDQDGDNVTTLIDNKECVFTYLKNGICLCLLEKAYNENITDFPKPISCHLYPIRLTKYNNFTAVNVHRWECCKSAEQNGKTKGLPLYRFLKTPLIREFGQQWYEELEQAAKVYFYEFKTVN